MPFTQKELYDVVVDVEQYHEFVPWCLKSTVTRRVSPNRFEADLEVGFNLFNVKYTSVVTTEAPQVVHSVAADAAVFQHLSNHWEIAQGPTPGTSWLTFSVDFAFKSALYRQAASLFFDQVQKKMIEAFHDRCMKQYRSPVRSSAARPHH
jgi:ribosome-associated toxin RatA of RatAB toxin-antitoxin module